MKCKRAALNDDAIGVLFNSTRHQRPLARIAIAAATEDAPQGTVTVRPQGTQRRFDGGRRVRIVHEYVRPVTGIDTLQSPWRRFCGRERSARRIECHLFAEQECKHEGRIGDIEFTVQRQQETACTP